MAAERLESLMDKICTLQQIAREDPKAYLELTREHHFEVKTIWEKTADAVKASRREWRQSACWGCSRAPPEGEVLLWCQNCKAASYCNRVCQKQDWTAHKLTCQATGRLMALFKTAVSEREGMLRDAAQWGIEIPELRREWMVCMMPFLGTTYMDSYSPDFVTHSHSIMMNLMLLGDSAPSLDWLLDQPAAASFRQGAAAVRNSAPFLQLPDVSSRTVDGVNLLRAFAPTHLVYDTHDSVLANGRLGAGQTRDWQAAETEMGELYARELEELAGRLGIEISLGRMLDIQLRIKRARGFTHIVVRVVDGGEASEQGFAFFSLDDLDIWRRVRDTRPTEFDRLVTKFGQVACPEF